MDFFVFSDFSEVWIITCQFDIHTDFKMSNYIHIDEWSDKVKAVSMSTTNPNESEYCFMLLENRRRDFPGTSQLAVFFSFNMNTCKH